MSVVAADRPEPAARPPGRPRDERATRAMTEAALRQLAEVGYARVSMESIATEAGVAGRLSTAASRTKPI